MFHVHFKALISIVLITNTPFVATAQCEDSPFSFKLKKGKPKWRKCKWVSKKKDKRCKLNGVTETCPKTCSSCSTCIDSPLQFKLNAIKKRKCQWVLKKNKEARCSKFNGLVQTCRVTCDNCPDDNGGSSKLASIEDFVYNGSFRLPNGEFGDSSIQYAVGIIAHNPDADSFFIVGHDWQNAIAEFDLTTPGCQTSVAELPVTNDPKQNFKNIIAGLTNPEGINRITGMMMRDGKLIVNAENWYDAGGQNKDTTFVVADATNLEGSDVEGFFRLEGGVRAAGYMGTIPDESQTVFGSDIFTGWSSVHSIVLRYSLGPTLWTFDADDLLEGSAETNPDVSTKPYMNFPYTYSANKAMSPGALDSAAQGANGPFGAADALWNILSDGVYGFFIPETDTFAVIGWTSGLNSGIGYKAIQEDGTVCGGYCAYETDDYSNYYWLFDVNDILNAQHVWDPRPYAYGSWDVPFDEGGKHNIIGATFDPDKSTLYVVLANAAKLQEFDQPPLIVTFLITNKEGATGVC